MSERVFEWAIFVALTATVALVEFMLLDAIRSLI